MGTLTLHTMRHLRRSRAIRSATPTAAPVTTSRYLVGPLGDLALVVATPRWTIPLLFALGALYRERVVNEWIAALGALGHHLPGLLSRLRRSRSVPPLPHPVHR